MAEGQPKGWEAVKSDAGRGVQVVGDPAKALVDFVAEIVPEHSVLGAIGFASSWLLIRGAQVVSTVVAIAGEVAIIGPASRALRRNRESA